MGNCNWIIHWLRVTERHYPLMAVEQLMWNKQLMSIRKPVLSSFWIVAFYSLQLKMKHRWKSHDSINFLFADGKVLFSFKWLSKSEGIDFVIWRNSIYSVIKNIKVPQSGNVLYHIQHQRVTQQPFYMEIVEGGPQYCYLPQKKGES